MQNKQSTPKQEIYSIHCYDLLTFVQEVEKASKLGFTVDTKTISHYPQLLGYQFIMTMVKDVEEAQTVADVQQESQEKDLRQGDLFDEQAQQMQLAREAIEDVLQPKQQAKRGPKAKI